MLKIISERQSLPSFALYRQAKPKLSRCPFTFPPQWKRTYRCPLPEGSLLPVSPPGASHCVPRSPHLVPATVCQGLPTWCQPLCARVFPPGGTCCVPRSPHLVPRAVCQSLLTWCHPLCAKVSPPGASHCVPRSPHLVPPAVCQGKTGCLPKSRQSRQWVSTQVCSVSASLLSRAGFRSESGVRTGFSTV